MQTRRQLQSALRWLAALAVVSALAACSIFGPQVVNHAFGFDMRYDNQDAVVLDWRYGDTKLPANPPKDLVEAGHPFYFQSVEGPMLRPDFLYVKWRILSTGKVYQDTVDLRQRLPDNIEHHRITFLIRGPQLYVYLIPPITQRRPAGVPPNGPSMYDFLNVITIYPNQPKQ